MEDEFERRRCGTLPLTVENQLGRVVPSVLFINTPTPFSTATAPCGSPSNLVLSQLVVEDERPMCAKQLVKLLVSTSFAKL
jgi:hypothetical protein